MRTGTACTHLTLGGLDVADVAEAVGAVALVVAALLGTDSVIAGQEGPHHAVRAGVRAVRAEAARARHQHARLRLLLVRVLHSRVLHVRLHHITSAAARPLHQHAGTALASASASAACHHHSAHAAHAARLYHPAALSLAQLVVLHLPRG